MDGSSRSIQSGGPRTQSELACNICLRRMPNRPVLTYCGHVFCWPCLYRSWPQQGPGVQADPAITKSCPVCGTAIREGFNIVPIYGYDNVASPRSGTERPTSTSTTTAAAAPDTATSSRPTVAAPAPVFNTPIPPRFTAASFFTATPLRPHSVAARAAAAAAPSTAIPPRPAAAAVAVSSDTDIPPRPNPPARITQTHTQSTQTDAARSLRNLSSTIPHHGTLGGMFRLGAGDRLRPSSSAARNINLAVASRFIRRRRNLRLNPRGMNGNGGNRFESYRARLNRVLNEILVDIGATLEDIDALFDDRVVNGIMDDIEATLEDIDALFDARDERDDDLT